MTWDGVKLSALDVDTLRLRFHMERAISGDSSPKLYSYGIEDGKPKPTVEKVHSWLPAQS